MPFLPPQPPEPLPEPPPGPQTQQLGSELELPAGPRALLGLLGLRVSALTLGQSRRGIWFEV